MAKRRAKQTGAVKHTATNASGLTLAQWIRAASFAQGHGLGPSDFRQARSDWEADVDPAEWGRPRSPRHHATRKSPAQLQREIDEALASPLSKHHRYLLSRRTPGGGLGAGYLTPSGWHGDPMAIEDRKLRLEALREQSAPSFPKDPHRSHATRKQAEQSIEPLPHNREWHNYIVGQGGELVARYKGADIHRNGLAYYVNGHYVGTSMRRAKDYVNTVRL